MIIQATRPDTQANQSATYNYRPVNVVCSLHWSLKFGWSLKRLYTSFCGGLDKSFFFSDNNVPHCTFKIFSTSRDYTSVTAIATPLGLTATQSNCYVDRNLEKLTMLTGKKGVVAVWGTPVSLVAYSLVMRIAVGSCLNVRGHLFSNFVVFFFFSEAIYHFDLK